MFDNVTREQLSQISDILWQLDESKGAQPESDRRHADRINIRTTLMALAISKTGNSELKVFTRNLSTSGIGFVCRRQCKVGSRVVLTFALPGKPRKRVLARVTFCRYIRSAWFEAGAEFLESAPAPTEASRLPEHWLHAGPEPATNASVSPSPSAGTGAKAEKHPAAENAAQA